MMIAHFRDPYGSLTVRVALGPLFGGCVRKWRKAVAKKLDQCKSWTALRFCMCLCRHRWGSGVGSVGTNVHMRQKDALDNSKCG
mmetsp:Transcript_89986/g.150419  ORF Transcript_89986/g.150419 Transcript_89986/m.150419 type:complete len:84 (+) Transcript_89986:1677-1928(+)